MIAGLSGKSMFSFLRKHQHIFRRGGTSFAFPPAMRSVPVAPHPRQPFVLSVLRALAMLTGVEWCLVVLPCISLMTYDVEHLFTCLFAICMFYFFLNFISFIFLYSRFLLVIYFIHISVYMSIPISQFIPPPPPAPATFPPWCPYVCSLHLCLCFCPATWFICTIFLGSTYMR